MLLLARLRFRRCLLGLRLRLLRRGQDHRHGPSFQRGLAIDGAVVGDLLGEPVEEIAPDVGVTDLSPTELDRDLDPVAVLQEADRALDLGVEVTFADLDPEADLLELDRTLVLARFLIPTGLLVLLLTVVEDLGDRRVGHGRDLDEVETTLLRQLQGLGRGHDTQLCPLFVDDPHLGDSDHLVDSQVLAQAIPSPLSLFRYVPGTARHKATTCTGRRRTIAHGRDRDGDLSLARGYSGPLLAACSASWSASTSQPMGSSCSPARVRGDTIGTVIAVRD